MHDDDWTVLMGFLPPDWQALAAESGALKGLRKAKNAEHLLRTLLIHLACGYSLRETVVRARQAQLADLSDVALLKRLRKCKEWLYALCRSLLAERGVAPEAGGGQTMRLFDATTVKEPGRTGGLWRIHYSLSLPSLRCDFFKVTETRGDGTGEALGQFPIHAGDWIWVDAGYCTAQGAAHVEAQGAFLSVRFNPQAVRLAQPDGQPFGLLEALEATLTETGPVACWPVRIASRDGEHRVEGRLCAIRKSREAIELAHQRIRRQAGKHGSCPAPETFVYAQYVMVFTTIAPSRLSAQEVLQWYRLRWQIELVFKRFKQLAQAGHLPKYEDESATAWLYGKLLVALLVEKMRDHAQSFSPWGYELRLARNP